MQIIIKTELIEKFMKENNLTKTAFCKLCKINIKTLNKFFASKHNMRMEPLYKILKTINAAFNELIYIKEN